jgi:hypothetical protein
LTEKTDSRIVSINGGKKQKDLKSDLKVFLEHATLQVDGEITTLGSFILSGETPEGKRVLFTWNCSIDEMISYAATLNCIVNKRVESILNI